MRCLHCNIQGEGPLCGQCAAYYRHYIESLWDALAAGVHLDSGTIGNVTIYERYLERREAWLATREAEELRLFATGH